MNKINLAKTLIISIFAAFAATNLIQSMNFYKKGQPINQYSNGSLFPDVQHNSVQIFK